MEKKHGCFTCTLCCPDLPCFFKLLTMTAYSDPGQLLQYVLLHGEVRMFQQAEYSLTSLFLLLSTAVVPLLTSVPLFLCAPPSSVRLHQSLPLTGSDQAGGLACPAEPNSAACRLRGMYSTAALPSLSSGLPLLPLSSSCPIEALQWCHRPLNSFKFYCLLMIESNNI